MQTWALLCYGQPLLFKGHPRHTSLHFFNPSIILTQHFIPIFTSSVVFTYSFRAHLDILLYLSVLCGSGSCPRLRRPECSPGPRSVRWKIHQSLGATQLGKILRPSTDLICQVPVGGEWWGQINYAPPSVRWSCFLRSTNINWEACKWENKENTSLPRPGNFRMD